MEPSQRPAEKRSRLTPDVRREQIVDAAARIILEQGHLPLNLNALARSVGVSKALVYALFHTQHDLFNAVLDREFRALSARDVTEASALSDLHDASLACALAYFDHIVANGPLIHVILRDPYMAGQVARPIAAFRDRIVIRLARLSRQALRLPAKENIAAINLVITIPEEAGRLVHTGTLSPERGRLLCSQLVMSSLEAFTPQTE